MESQTFINKRGCVLSCWGGSSINSPYQYILNSEDCQIWSCKKEERVALVKVTKQYMPASVKHIRTGLARNVTTEKAIRLVMSSRYQMV